MKRTGIRWLLDELPGLVKAGIISDTAAGQLEKHYTAKLDPESRRRTALIVLGVLGATLIGAGIVMLIAHNWTDLSRPARAAISLGLLVVAQLLAGWTLWKKPQSIALVESTAVLLMLALGGCIALVSQTYNLYGLIGEILLLWMLLSCPIIYLTRSRMVALFYLAGSVWCVGEQTPWELQTRCFLLLVALILPFLWQLRGSLSTQKRSALVYWAAAICIPIGAAIVLFHGNRLPAAFCFSALFATLYACGTYLSKYCSVQLRNPLRLIGTAGVALVALILSYSEASQDMGQRWLEHMAEPAVWGCGLCGLLLALPALFLAVRAARKAAWAEMLFTVAPLVTLLGYVLSMYDWPAMLLFNAYLLVLGLELLVRGLREGSAFLTNSGMAMLVPLFIARCFDFDLTFIGRGIVFIVIGVGILMINMRFLKASKGDLQ